MPEDIERMLAEEMEAFSARKPALDETLRAWRPLSYPIDFGRKQPMRDDGPEWDFYPADERWN